MGPILPLFSKVTEASVTHGSSDGGGHGTWAAASHSARRFADAVPRVAKASHSFFAGVSGRSAGLPLRTSNRKLSTTVPGAHCSLVLQSVTSTGVKSAAHSV